MDGWSIVNGLKEPSVLQKKPALKEYSVLEEKDDFTRGILSKDWMFPREPEKDAILWKEKALLLKASKKNLSTIFARNILLRRQTDFCFTFLIELEIEGLEQGQETGIICYYDENTYLTYSVYQEEQRYFLKVLEHIGEEEYLTKEVVSIDNKRLELKIKTDGLKRECCYKDIKKEWKTAKILENVYYLCDEGLKKGKRFTGAMVGIYSYSNKKTDVYGKFRRLEYFTKEDEDKGGDKNGTGTIMDCR